MKLYALILSCLMMISLSSCRDMNTRDSTPVQDGTTPGQTSTQTDYNRDQGITDSGKMDRDRSNTNTSGNTDSHTSMTSNTARNRTLTANQRDSLYRKLNLTDDQSRRLEELRGNRAGDDMNQMDRDFRNVLNDNQYNKYEKWKRDNNL